MGTMDIDCDSYNNYYKKCLSELHEHVISSFGLDHDDIFYYDIQDNINKSNINDNSNNENNINDNNSDNYDKFSNSDSSDNNYIPLINVINDRNKYDYNFKPLKDCKTIGCVIIHCFETKLKDIPNANDIINQLK